MAETLVEKLRTCPSGQRRDIALLMAKDGTDGSIVELIRMADGRRRVGWDWYILEDQLTAIDALGETGNEQALNYLHTLSSRDSRITSNQGVHTERARYCPNARGELSKELRSSSWSTYYPPGCDTICGFTPYPEEEDRYYGRTQDSEPYTGPQIRAELSVHPKPSEPDPPSSQTEIGAYERILRSIIKLEQDPRIRLRLCPDEKRRDVALELAREATDHAVSEMKRMVEGGLRTRSGSIWTLWIPVRRYYNEEDKKIGLEALRATGRPEALEYLKYVNLVASRRSDHY